MNQFKEIFRYKLIYIFEINDAAHKGLLKIGETSINTTKFLSPNTYELNQAAKKRIEKYTTTAGINFNLLHTELAVKDNAQSFRDYNVHKVLIRSGYKKNPPKGSNAKEWFKVDLATAKQAISAVKQNKKTVSGADSETFIPISFRPEQERAINLTVKNFKKNNKMLWNAKMRFGKTLCALEVVRRMNFAKTVIVTHRPVVNEGWYEDFRKIFHDNNNFAYSSKNCGESVQNLLNGNKNFVYFASIQDLRGSDTVGGKFDKNLEIFGTDWNFVIVDEAHEGTTTALGESVINNLVGKNTKFLALSGTPFNIVEDYDPKETFTWDYIDEQQAKADWDKNNGGDSNPYAELPQLNIFTYNLGALLNNPDFFDEDKTFNFKEFFRTDDDGNFIHKKHINNFLELLTKSDAKSNYPYSNEKYRNLFRHTLWIIPGVKEGRALSNLLKNHFVFQHFKILNIAGTEDEGSADPQKTLDEVKNAIAENNYTITLSCGKLTTGVTVPEWTAVFMLAGSYSTSAASYMQTIFRVQSPYNIDGKFKENCYVFDFAPDRTLKIISESLSIYGKSQIKYTLKNFLNFCPVIAIEGSIMKEYNAPKLMQTLKRVYAERAVRNGFDDTNLYSPKLLQLDSNALKKFENLKAIIGTSKAQEKTKTIDINDNRLKGSTTTKGGGKKGKDPQLEKRKKQRLAAISILRGISIRMPLLIYGADIPIDEDFKIEMLLDDNIVDQKSWDEFMPRGVTKDFFKDFIQYYDEDIFIAAGRKIRNIAKKADELTPTERVKKIAELFSYFKNPDKETVLTSWRVVNLHLSSALGGFDFFDDEHKNILPAPRFVSHGKITDDTLANENAKILEINSKTGLYPLFVAYSLYRAQLGKAKESRFDLHTLQHIWDEILQNNIFVICKTPMAQYITCRTLAGFRHKNLNANYFENLIHHLKFEPDYFIINILSKNYWNKGAGTMKFDAVVGNPPYQIMQEGGNENYSSPIYHEFLKVSFKLNTKVTMIHPARCFFNAGNTPEEFNKKILHEKHLKIIKYEIDSSKFFPNTDIKGGIAITYYDPDPNIDFGFIELFVPFEELKSIYKKVVTDNKNFLPIKEIVYGRSQYRLTEKFIEENPNATFIKERRNDFFKTNVFEFAKDYFFDKKPNDGKEYIQVWGLIKNKRHLKFIRADYINVGENKINFYNYKIIIPEANGSGAIGEKLSTPLVGLPLVGNTQTFITLGAFDTEAEAANALKFVKTKFARALLGVLKVTQHNPPETWACVPLQDFTADSDIDWSRSIPEIDKQLYSKYRLDDAEIKFIEEKVKAMD